MTATPETPVVEGENTNSESAESKQNGSTVNEEENNKENEMPPNEADMGTAKAPTTSESAPLASSEDLKVKFTGGASAGLGDGKEVKVDIIDAEKKEAELLAMKAKYGLATPGRAEREKAESNLAASSK